MIYHTPLCVEWRRAPTTEYKEAALQLACWEVSEKSRLRSSLPGWLQNFLKTLDHQPVHQPTSQPALQPAQPDHDPEDTQQVHLSW